MDKDASQMTDEELATAVNPEVETPVSAPTEAPPEPEVAPEEAPEPTEEVEAAPQEEDKEEVPAPPSRREQLRIQSLLKKYGPPEQRNSQFKRTDALDYQTALDADPEVIQQLEADRHREGQAQYNEGLRRAEFLDWKTSLKIDAPTIEKTYPVLDAKSPEFHPAVADAVNNWYLSMSGYDPQTNTVANSNVSYAEFVEGFMELVQETAGQKNAQTVKNVAKQAATTGIRPDGSSAKRLNLNQSEKTMSIDELYAAIGQKPPK